MPTDTERLDWISSHFRSFGRRGPSGPWYVAWYAGMGEWVDEATGATLRDAIDAAMRAEGESD